MDSQGFRFEVVNLGKEMVMEIKIEKNGSITGIGRYTEIPFRALKLSESNMMFPDTAKARVFECKDSRENK